MRFRKKPVVIEAFMWTGMNNCLPDWAKHHREIDIASISNHDFDDGPFVPFGVIQTLEGRMRFNVGDWIIKGVKGELYPCKADIFEATYEKVED